MLRFVGLQQPVRWDGGTTKPLLRQHLTTAWFSGPTILTWYVRSTDYKCFSLGFNQYLLFR